MSPLPFRIPLSNASSRWKGAEGGNMGADGRKPLVLAALEAMVARALMGASRVEFISNYILEVELACLPRGLNIHMSNGQSLHEGRALTPNLCWPVQGAKQPPQQPLAPNVQPWSIPGSFPHFCPCFQLRINRRKPHMLPHALT